jgi:hypothetical protein
MGYQMAQVKVEGDVAAPIEDVWKLVGDFVGFISSQGLEVAGEGQGIGMLRTITIGSMTIVERLEALDDSNHRTSYSIVSGPIPVTDYLSTIELTSAGDAVTKVTWSSNFEPTGITEEQAIQMIEPTYQGGIKALRKHFAA